MAVNGKAAKGYSLRVGYGEYKVLKFNPTREELNEMLGINSSENIEDIVYTGVDEEGYSKATISVWVEEISTKEKHNLRFTLVDKVVMGKNSGKTQYINVVGDTGWGFSETDLQRWFTHFVNQSGQVVGTKAYRECKVGEGNFYNFLRSWFNINWFDASAELVFDSSKWFNGNYDELNKYINQDITQTIVIAAGVRVVEKDDEIKEYQSMYNGAFLPGKMIKGLRLGSDHKAIKRFKDTINGEYGFKDYFVMEDIRDYVPGENLAATNNTIVTHSSDDTDY